MFSHIWCLLSSLEDPQPLSTWAILVPPSFRGPRLQVQRFVSSSILNWKGFRMRSWVLIEHLRRIWGPFVVQLLADLSRYCLLPVSTIFWFLRGAAQLHIMLFGSTNQTDHRLGGQLFLDEPFISLVEDIEDLVSPALGKGNSIPSHTLNALLKNISRAQSNFAYQRLHVAWKEMWL